jgi:hypothetical protein
MAVSDGDPPKQIPARTFEFPPAKFIGPKENAPWGEGRFP